MNPSDNNPFFHTRLKRSARRLQRGANLIKTGISFIDDACLGVSPGDLYVIAGGTGFGKTELATAISLTAAKQTGVYFLALESEEGEIEDRLLYRSLSERLIAKKNYISFPEFRVGKADLEYSEDLAAAESELINQGNFLDIHTPRNINAGILSSLIEPDGDYGLIVCDHLHYLELEGRNENEGISDAMKKIRDATLFADKPMILLSHLRKPDRYSSDIPTFHDLHGSSEITKRATAVIIISRSKAKDPDPNISLTTMQIAKFRHDQSRVKFFAQLKFNLKTRSYEQDYYLALKNDKSELELIQDRSQIPYWAKNAKPYPKSMSIEIKEYQL